MFRSGCHQAGKPETQPVLMPVSNHFSPGILIALLVFEKEARKEVPLACVKQQQTQCLQCIVDTRPLLSTQHHCMQPRHTLRGMFFYGGKSCN